MGKEQLWCLKTVFLNFLLHLPPQKISVSPSVTIMTDKAAQAEIATDSLYLEASLFFIWRLFIVDTCSDM